jgi:hypothetical protein
MNRHALTGRAHPAGPQAFGALTMFCGKLMCGKVDQVGNLCYVQTEFFHVLFVPLVPLQTYLVMVQQDKDSPKQAVPLPLCFKSVLIGWARATAILAMIFSAMAGAVTFIDQAFSKLALLWTVAFLGSMVAYWLTCCFNTASYDRAVQLGERLGIARSVIAEMYLAFPSPEVDAPE